MAYSINACHTNSSCFCPWGGGGGSVVGRRGREGTFPNMLTPSYTFGNVKMLLAEIY
jgi:hypothetical protein